MVNPTLLPNDAAEADLGQRNYIIDGINGFDFVQLNDEQEIEDQVVL